mgnify:CR=1 FL=1
MNQKTYSVSMEIAGTRPFGQGRIVEMPLAAIRHRPIPRYGEYLRAFFGGLRSLLFQGKWNFALPHNIIPM